MGANKSTVSVPVALIPQQGPEIERYGRACPPRQLPLQPSPAFRSPRPGNPPQPDPRLTSLPSSRLPDHPDAVLSPAVPAP